MRKLFFIYIITFIIIKLIARHGASDEAKIFISFNKEIHGNLILIGTGGNFVFFAAVKRL